MSGARDELAKVAYIAKFPGHKEAAVADWDYLQTHTLHPDKRALVEQYTLKNDGTYEYTLSSDCDGSNVTHWRRVPGMTHEGHASPWEAYDPEPAK